MVNHGQVSTTGIVQGNQWVTTKGRTDKTPKPKTRIIASDERWQLDGVENRLDISETLLPFP